MQIVFVLLAHVLRYQLLKLLPDNGVEWNLFEVLKKNVILDL